MNLVPVRPPGPNARKARAFAAEILQLRAQGYTFEAIREALAGAGVHVSNSTVQREVARATGQRPASTLADAAESRSPGQTHSKGGGSVQARLVSPPAAPVSPAISLDSPKSGSISRLDCKQDAEAFFAAHDSNPLSPTKESS